MPTVTATTQMIEPRRSSARCSNSVIRASSSARFSTGAEPFGLGLRPGGSGWRSGASLRLSPPLVERRVVGGRRKGRHRQVRRASVRPSGAGRRRPAAGVADRRSSWPRLPSAEGAARPRTRCGGRSPRADRASLGSRQRVANLGLEATARHPPELGRATRPRLRAASGSLVGAEHDQGDHEEQQELLRADVEHAAESTGGAGFRGLGAAGRASDSTAAATGGRSRRPGHRGRSGAELGDGQTVNRQAATAAAHPRRPVHHGADTAWWPCARTSRRCSSTVAQPAVVGTAKWSSSRSSQEIEPPLMHLSSSAGGSQVRHAAHRCRRGTRLDGPERTRLPSAVVARRRRRRTASWPDPRPVHSLPVVRRPIVATLIERHAWAGMRAVSRRSRTGAAHSASPTAGARAHAPENTLEAFRLALRLGATGLESDVWLTERRRWPSSTTTASCAPACAGGRSPALRRDQLPAHIPTLAELYEACGTAFELSLDVKDPAAAAGVDRRGRARRAMAPSAGCGSAIPTGQQAAAWRAARRTR